MIPTVPTISGESSTKKGLPNLGEKYQVLKMIGKGAYGKVYQAIETSTGKKLAVKEFENALSSKRLAQYCLREIEIMRNSVHDNIMKLHAVMRLGLSVYLVMDHMPYDLRKLIHTPKYFEHEEVTRLFYELLLALNYLHSARIVHRDVKPGNILLTEDNKVRLCDFGQSRSINGLKNSVDFDEIYRREFAKSNEQNMVAGVTDTSENGDEEDVNEYVEINRVKTIPGHFGFPSKPFIDEDSKEGGEKAVIETHPPAKAKTEDLAMMRTSSCNPIKEELKTSKTTPKVSVRACRQQFINSLKRDPYVARELTSHVASRWYRAPEVILIEKAYSTSVDIWGAGCVFGELLQMINGNRAGYSERQPLFPGGSCFPLSPQLKRGSETEIEHFPADDQLIVICKTLGTPTPEEMSFIIERGARDYLELLPKSEKKDWAELYPACTVEELDLLQKMLTFNPFMRITAKEALRHPYFKDVRRRDLETEGHVIAIDVAADKNTAIEQLLSMCG